MASAAAADDETQLLNRNPSFDRSELREFGEIVSTSSMN